MKHIALILGLFLAFSTPAFAVEVEEKVDKELGEELVALANVVGHGALDGGWREDGFFIYQLWGESYGTKGWFAVNPWTGDVWDTMAGPNCKHYTTPALAKEQEQIKKRFTKAELKEYKHLSELKPRRLYDLELCGSPEEK